MEKQNRAPQHSLRIGIASVVEQALDIHGCITVSAICSRLPFQVDPFDKQARIQELSAFAGIGVGLIRADVFLACDLALAGCTLKGSSTWLSRDELIQTTVTRRAENMTQAATIPKMMTAMVSSLIVLLSCCQTRCWPWIKLTKTGLARGLPRSLPAQAVRRSCGCLPFRSVTLRRCLPTVLLFSLLYLDYKVLK